MNEERVLELLGDAQKMRARHAVSLERHADTLKELDGVMRRVGVNIASGRSEPKRGRLWKRGKDSAPETGADKLREAMEKCDETWKGIHFDALVKYVNDTIFNMEHDVVEEPPEEEGCDCEVCNKWAAKSAGTSPDAFCIACKHCQGDEPVDGPDEPDSAGTHSRTIQ